MLVPVLLACSLGEDLAGPPWRAALTTPGGPLEFALAFGRAGDGLLHAFLLNGQERIEIPRIEFDGRELMLDMPHYDSRIRARLKDHRLVGTWTKRRSAESLAEVPFQADRGSCTVPGTGGAGQLSGRWSVDFETEEDDAVALFEGSLQQIRGTFPTSTGDYRYLAGWATAQELTLSCFDGAHAFLFKAKLQTDGTLKGDFWSGNWHHETWTARRDDNAQLADPFAQTRWTGTPKLADLAFPDLDGTKHSRG